MRRRLLLNMILVSTILLSGGCSWSNLLTPSDVAHAELVRHAKWRKQTIALFDQYIGKTPQKIESIFGKPKKMYKANPPSYVLPSLADEMWDYGYLPIGDADLYIFLFKDKRFINVDVLAQRQSKTQKTLSYLSM